MKIFMVLLLCGLSQCQQEPPSDLRPESLSITREGDSVRYSLKYRSTQEAHVMFSVSNGPIFEETDSSVDINTGERTASQLVDGNKSMERMSVYVPGSNSNFIDYDLGSVRGQNHVFNLPETQVWSPQRTDWTYTPGVPFEVRVRISPTPARYNRPRLQWAFIGIDADDQSRSLQFMISDQYDTERFVYNVTTESYDGFEEHTATLNLTASRGLASVSASYNNDDDGPFISTESVFNVYRNTDSGPFPDGFLGVYMPLQFVGRQGIECSNGDVCTVQCVAVGRNIESFVLRRPGHDDVTPRVMDHEEEFTWAYFQVSPQTDDDFGIYNCKATNSDNVSKEVPVTVARRRGHRRP